MLASQAQTLRCHHKPGFTSNSSARIPSYTGLWKASLPRRPGKALPTSFVFRSRRRLTCRALLEQEASNSSPKVSLFGREQQLSGPQKILEGLPAPARYVGSAAVVAGALAAGYLLGGRVPIGRYQGSQVAAVGGAVSLGVIGGATVFAFNAAAPQVAAVQLRNKLVNHSDPTSLTPTEIDEVGKKYDIHVFFVL